jgi:hypothetical protein
LESRAANDATTLVILIDNPTTYSVNKTRKAGEPRFGRGLFRYQNASLILVREASDQVLISINLFGIVANYITPIRHSRESGNPWFGICARARVGSRFRWNSVYKRKTVITPTPHPTGTNPESVPISDSGVVRSPLNLNKNGLRQIGTIIG